MDPYRALAANLHSMQNRAVVDWASNRMRATKMHTSGVPRFFFVE